ncbi:MAG TPA: SdrD B-like domain-containing protein [Dehalococcoidia bacterium]
MDLGNHLGRRQSRRSSTARRKGIRIINVSLVQKDVEIARTQPDDSGRYRFSGIAPGSYVVRLTQAPNSFFWTFPAQTSLGPYETGVNITTGAVTNIDFGLKSLDGLPQFGGSVWVDAQSAIGADVRAFINGIDCTAGAPANLFETLGPSRWAVRVLSAAYKPGCGEAGKSISFAVGGRAAILTLNQTEPVVPVWGPAQATTVATQLVVGSSLQTFEAILIGVDRDGDGQADAKAGALVDAFVGDVPCGHVVMLDFPVQFIAIASSTLIPGCAQRGSPIRFVLDGAPVLSFRTLALDGLHTGPTEPWLEGVRGVDLVLQPPSTLRPPATGSAGSKQAHVPTPVILSSDPKTQELIHDYEARRP